MSDAITRARELLASQPANVQAQYASYAGSMDDAAAMRVIRRLGNIQTPDTTTIGDLPGSPGAGGNTTGYGKRTPDDGASDKQVAFIASLRAERALDAITTPLGKREASDMISALLAMPKPAKVTTERPSVQLSPGIYQLDSDIYRVKRSRSSGYLYAEKHDGSGWDYDLGRGAIRKLSPENLMTTEQAHTFGMKWSVCVNGHALSDRVSRYFGYGETCAGNNGWTYDKSLVPDDFK